MIDFEKILTTLLDLEGYLQIDYLKKSQRESGFSEEVFWMGLNDYWARLKAYANSMRFPIKREESDGENVLYVDTLINPKVYSDLEELWLLLMLYRIESKQGKIMAFAVDTGHDDVKSISPLSFIEIAENKGQEHFISQIKQADGHKAIQFTIDQHLKYFLNFIPKDYHNDNLKDWWLEKAREIINQIEPKETLIIEPKEEKKYSAATLGLFCFTINDAQIYPMEVTETNTKYIKRVCEHFGLNEKEGCNKFFGAQYQNIKKYKKVKQDILPFILESDIKNNLEEYIEAQIIRLKSKSK